MELKDAWTLRPGLLQLRFNRTFMELKDASTFDNAVSVLFQSHLYGIESYDRAEFVAGEILFQSHLYGIESGKTLSAFCEERVSIAPLWNWKFTTWRTWNRLHRVSIAPLWNWKLSRVLRSCHPSLFQSHLYGIESTGDLNAIELGNVFQSHLYGIEREGRGEHRGRCCGFQSHLYGIERWFALM